LTCFIPFDVGPEKNILKKSENKWFPKYLSTSMATLQENAQYIYKKGHDIIVFLGNFYVPSKNIKFYF
jgi:hypothetical protein